MPARLTLALARTLIDAALAEARRQGFKPMGVVVVDAAAQVVASAREDGASALRLDIALGKAAASVGMGVNSRALAVRAKDMPAFFTSIAAVTPQHFIAQTGAVLIVDDEDGAVLGAAGASGGTGDEDEQICIAGIAAAGLKHA
jgi:uncharacterized protein GlcG (DUF336 family)